MSAGIGWQVFMTGVVAMAAGASIELASGKRSDEVSAPVLWTFGALFFGGIVTCLAGALIAIWSPA